MKITREQLRKLRLKVERELGLHKINVGTGFWKTSRKDQKEKEKNTVRPKEYESQ